MARVKQLEDLARTMVGDGKSPNVYFVSFDGNQILVTTEFQYAYDVWKGISTQLQVETALEDRQQGVLASIEPESDEPGAPLIRHDDTGLAGVRGRRLPRLPR